MRITSGMVSEASQKAGMPLTGSQSLAGYLNEDSSKTLAATLGDKSSLGTNVLSKGKYEKMKDAAERLEQYADALTSAGSGSVYEKAKESGDSSELCDEVERLVSAYNETLDKLSSDMSAMGRFYMSSFKEVVAENKNTLKNLGISTDKNGRMSVDREKLRDADAEQLERVFGGSGTLSSRLNLIAGKVADNAQANVRSIFSQYNAAGSSVDTLLSSYDTKR